MGGHTACTRGLAPNYKGAGSLWRDKLAMKDSSSHGVENMVRAHPQAPSDMSGASSEKTSIGFRDFNH